MNRIKKLNLKNSDRLNDDAAGFMFFLRLYRGQFWRISGTIALISLFSTFLLRTALLYIDYQIPYSKPVNFFGYDVTHLDMYVSLILMVFWWLIYWINIWINYYGYKQFILKPEITLHGWNELANNEIPISRQNWVHIAFHISITDAANQKDHKILQAKMLALCNKLNKSFFFPPRKEIPEDEISRRKMWKPDNKNKLSISGSGNLRICRKLYWFMKKTLRDVNHKGSSKIQVNIVFGNQVVYNDNPLFIDFSYSSTNVVD